MHASSWPALFTEYSARFDCAEERDRILCSNLRLVYDSIKAARGSGGGQGGRFEEGLDEAVAQRRGFPKGFHCVSRAVYLKRREGKEQKDLIFQASINISLHSFNCRRIDLMFMTRTRILRLCADEGGCRRLRSVARRLSVSQKGNGVHVCKLSRIFRSAIGDFSVSA